MSNSRKADAQKMFSLAESGHKWDALYAVPTTLDDDHFIRRRNATAQYILSTTPTDARILDLGCGAGVLTERLLEGGFTVDAADQSPDMLELAKARLQRFPPRRWRLHQAECENLPFPDACFDVVACIGVFGYLDDVDSALQEIRRVLKPGGRLLISVRNYLNGLAFDPIQMVGMPLRALKKRLRKLRRTGGGPGPSRQFMIDIFDRPASVIRGVHANGYSLLDFFGVGYGPLRVQKKRVLPTRWNIWLSRTAQRIFEYTGVQRSARWIADISIYVFARSQ